MAKQIAKLLGATILAMTAAGCGTTPPARFYTLTATATTATNAAATTGAAPTSASGAKLTVVVGPVSIPAAVDRPQFVTAAGSNRVDVDTYNRWAEPLSDGIARAVAGDLTVLLGTGSEVAVAPLANFAPAYRVTLRVQRFESVLNESVVVDAVWVVTQEPGGAARSGHTVAHESVSGPGFDALAAAHSRAIATISADIAAAIRATAG